MAVRRMNTEQRRDFLGSLFAIYLLYMISQFSRIMFSHLTYYPQNVVFKICVHKVLGKHAKFSVALHFDN